MRRVAGGAVALGVVYALTLASADPVDLAIGVGLGAVLALLLTGRLRAGFGGADGPPLLMRVLWTPPFVAAVLVDVLRGTWDVALRVLGVRRLRCPGIIRVPIGERSPHGVAVSGLTLTLSPGSVLVDVDWERGHLLLHVIDASDPDRVRAQRQHLYDRYQRKVIP